MQDSRVGPSRSATLMAAEGGLTLKKTRVPAPITIVVPCRNAAAGVTGVVGHAQDLGASQTASGGRNGMRDSFWVLHGRCS